MPTFASDYLVNGEKVWVEEVSVPVKAGETKVVDVSFTVTPVIEKRPLDLNAVRYGSLLFALPIKYDTVIKEYERDGVERKFPYCDYEYHPQSKWNYGFADTVLSVEQRKVSDIPFSSVNPPLVIKAFVTEIEWGYADGYETVCAKVPESVKAIGERQQVELYPYGCAKLRMTELPFVE